MNETAMQERIKAALARFEASGKAKRGKRKSVKLFSLDRDDPREKQAGDFMTAKGRKLYANRQEETWEGQQGQGFKHTPPGGQAKNSDPI